MTLDGLLHQVSSKKAILAARRGALAAAKKEVRAGSSRCAPLPCMHTLTTAPLPKRLEMRPSALHAHAHHGAPSQTARDAPLCLACRRSQRRAPLPHRHAREAHQWQRLLTCPSRRPMCPSRRPTCPPPQWWRLRSTGWPPRRRCSQQSASPKGTCMQAPSTRWPTPSFVTMPRLSRHSNCWLGKSSAADSRPRWSG